MQPLPKTIQIFLPDGNARSIRIAEITSRTVQAVQVPRTKLKEADSRDELRRVGVYFLFGESEDDAKPIVYVGEAEDCYVRLKQHHVTKDFWTMGVVVTSKTHSFTKAHVKYLEWFCHDRALEAGRYRLENGSSPTKPYLPEPAVADLLDNFETIRVLLSTLGFPIFEEAAHPPEKRELFLCRGRGADGRGEYVEDGFLVLRGSKAPIGVTPSARGKYAEKIRERLLRSGIIEERDGHYIFIEDHLFSTPSGASDAVLGRNSNGWKEWKDAQGRTLDEVKRKNDI